MTDYGSYRETGTGLFLDFAKETHFPVNLCPRIPVYPYCREILPDFL